MASFHAELFTRHIPSKSALLSSLMRNNVVSNKELSASAYIFWLFNEFGTVAVASNLGQSH